MALPARFTVTSLIGRRESVVVVDREDERFVECVAGRNKKIGQWLCGSVGKVVASNTRVPRFESSHRQKFMYIEHLFTVNCVLKRQKQRKRGREWPI